MTLREKISALPKPHAFRQDGDITWFVFNEPDRRLETACVPARSVDQNNLCFWQLRSQVQNPSAVMRGHLRKIVDEVAATGAMTQRTISIVGAKRADGSEESIKVVVRDGGPQSFAWYDPIGSKDLRTPWQR
jgi:hypothetical protein